MFKIMHRICRSIGNPFDQDTWLLNHNLLIPLVESARTRRTLFKTESDFAVFDRYGQLLDPEFYSLDPAQVEESVSDGSEVEDPMAPFGYTLGGTAIGVSVA